MGITSNFVQQNHHATTISPLQFMQFNNGQSLFSALIDSGSQLNLITHSLLPFLNCTTKYLQTMTVHGITGKSNPIRQWIELPLTLQNGEQTTVTCAVITDLPCSILFGLPFLTLINAKHDVANAIVNTPKGPIPLLRRTPITTAANTATLTQDDVPIDLSASNLTEDEKRQVKGLMIDFEDLWRSGKRGKALCVAHRINLSHNRPIVMRPRQMSEEQKKIVKEEIDKMLEDGVIRASDSPYASEIVMVLKKTGDWRFCIDLRAINKATIPDKYPLPRINDLVHAVKDSKYFTALDLRAGYWQIPMSQESIKYTAFRCFLGLFEFLVMPFGLTNAPATFQRCMDFLFNDLRFNGVLCYLDDVLVHATTFKQAFTRLQTVFERLRAANLTLNLPKSIFFPKVLKYLGTIIENGKLYPDPKKIAILQKIATPQTLHDVRSILGFFGYYQAYIRRYAEVMSPVFRLLQAQKNTKRSNASTKIQWNEEHRNAIATAIHLLSCAVLEIPEEGDEFLVESDASDRAVAAILSIKRGDAWKPVEFCSQSLSTTQQKWPIREREAYAIVHALQKFDSYIRGRPVTVHTDHESLKWMLDSQKGKIARWSSLLAEYELTIFYKKGSALQHVDFLTRSLDWEPDNTLDSRMCYLAAVPEDLPALEDIIRAQHNEEPPTTKGYINKNGVVYYHGLIWVPPSYRIRVMAACHSLPPFRHQGIKRTKSTINRTFNWPGLHQDLARYLRSCLYCCRSRSGEERLQGLQRAHPTPELFDTVYMDFWKCTYNGEHFNVLTLIDSFSKWAECIPVIDAKAETVTSTFLRSWIYRYGVPRVLVSDRDRSFCNQVLDNVTAKLGINRLTSSPYHPEGNAVIESFHNTLALYLRSLHQPSLPFFEALDLSLFAYRATIHTTTAHSPSFLAYGRDPQLPIDQDWRMEFIPSSQTRIKFLSTLRLEVQLRAQQQAISRNMKRNVDRMPKEFQEQQLVLCRQIPMDRLKYRSAFYKAVPRWTTPHRVIQVLPTKNTAIVKCLLTGSCRQVHLLDVHFVEPPQGEVQIREWKTIFSEESPSFFRPEQVDRLIDQNMEPIPEPQLISPIDNQPETRDPSPQLLQYVPCITANPTPMSRKRQRLLSSAVGGSNGQPRP